jgi:DNA-binding SARP family transcriptional activator/tetratricopeptide (TPR) repeat protein
MAHLSLGVLGPLQVLLDDTPVTMFESDKVCALLVYLAVEADRPHRRESLVGLLWPECPEQVARHNLRQALFNLRQAIGDHAASPRYLLISREAIQFNRASDFSLDLAQFNMLLYTCQEERSRGIEDPSSHAARLEEMVQLYRGEFLQDFFLEDSAEFEQWALIQRESVHQRVLEACSHLADYYERHGDFQAARRHASRQLELDPWREEAHCQMMRALALDGQRSAALAHYEVCRRVLAEELGVEPSAKTRELVEQIRTGALKPEDESPASLPTAPIYNLPVSLTSFVGREQELMDLGQLIADPECRCISLVGPGGIGKTRLALQVAEQHRAGFAHGVAFVPLAPVDSVGAAISAMASAIRLSFYGPDDPRVQLLNTLCEKQMLLILDNVEHLLARELLQASIVKLVLETLEHAPGVKLLVTSREVLNLQEEWVFEVGGLAFPDTEQTEGLDAYAAVALFIQRARRASPGFAFPEADLAAIAQLCRLVEGMPLAIELAATWLRTLSPAEIAQEIEGSLDALSASRRDLPERHRSMRVVFDQTWRTLSAEEQQALSQVSVFRGGFSREAAGQVASASLPVLSTLVNRMLLRRTAASRYGLHPLVRQYSASRLAADPQAHAAAQKRHYTYFLALAEAAGQGLKGRDQLEWLRRLAQEQDNLRVALQWALESDQAAACGDELALRLSGALRLFWRMRGHFFEGRTWLTRSLRQCPRRCTAARAGALLGESVLVYALGDLDAARLSAEESAAICRELGDQRGLAEALTLVGLSLSWQGQASLTQARLEEALALCREAGDCWGEAQALHYLGKYRANSLGDPTGRAMLEQSVAILEGLGEKNVLTVALISLGTTEAGSGEYAPARALFERALALAREIEHPWGMANALTNLGCVFRIQGEYSTAQSHLEQALQLYHQHGSRIWEADVRCALAENALSQGDLSAARFHLEAASQMLGTGENKWLELLVRYLRGMLVHYGGDGSAAMTLLEEATALAREGRFKPDLARSLVALGRVTCALGQLLPASELLMEGLELFRALGDKLGIACAIEELGAVSAVQGDGVQAAMLFSTAHALREGMGVPLPPVDRAAHDSVVAACRTQLGETAFAEAWAEAAARPYQEVVEDVLDLRQSRIHDG